MNDLAVWTYFFFLLVPFPPGSEEGIADGKRAEKETRLPACEGPQTFTQSMPR